MIPKQIKGRNYLRRHLSSPVFFHQHKTADFRTAQSADVNICQIGGCIKLNILFFPSHLFSKFEIWSFGEKN